MLRGMTAKAKKLTHEEFVSLLTVGNATVNSAAPAIPAKHRARLIALGYMVFHEGRLRMTTLGRIRIYAGQLDT
jgi:cytochrome c peroxidase